MADCYKCEHQKDVADGKYKDMPFEETPCARCQVEPKSSPFVREYDEDRETSADPAVAEPFAAEGAAPEPMMPVGVLSEVVHGLLSLSPDQRDVVCYRHVGMPYKEIAIRQGVTTSMAELNHRRAMVKFPALRALFAVKSRKQARRRKPGSVPQRPEKSVRHGAGWRRAGGGFERTTMTPDFNDHDHRQTLYKKAG